MFSVSEALEVKVGNSAQQLGRHDCLQLVGNTGLLEVSSNGACCVIELTARCYQLKKSHVASELARE